MLRKILEAVGPSGRAKLNAAVGRKLSYLVRGHFLGLQSSRHATAERLGATPTNYWGKAAESVSMTSDDESSTVSIGAPGISRAAQDIDIVPGEGKKYLSIPIASESYGNRMLIGETAPRFENGFFFTSKAGNLIYAQKQGKGKDAQIHPLYLLKPSVHQQQDRSLLPSDDQFLDAALDTEREYLAATVADIDKQIVLRGADES